MSTTVNYKGSTLTTVNNQTKTLLTSGKWMEADLVVTDVTSDSSATLITKTINANGTYSAQDDSADGYSSVTVNVPPSGITPTGSINITTNGTHNVTNYASAVVSVPTGGGTPSATSHTILFEFTDETSTTITAYYDSSFISDAIRATTPTEYDGKTVDSASLDGTAWYTRPTETWETLTEGSTNVNPDTPYNYIWLGDLSDIYPSANDVFRITINSTEYRITAKQASTSQGNIICVGNPKYTGGTDDSSTVPFNFYNVGWGAWVGDTEISAPQMVTIKIERQVLA